MAGRNAAGMLLAHHATPDGRLAARALPLAGVAWVLIVLAFYYRRIWTLLATHGLAHNLAAASMRALPTLFTALTLAVLSLTAAALAGGRSEATRRSVLHAGLGAMLVLGVAGFLFAFTRGPGPLLPWLGEAASRAALGTWGAGLVTAAAWALGGAACRMVGGRPPFAYRIAIGWGVLAYLSLALAAGGLYRPPIVEPVVTALAALGAAAAGRDVWRRLRLDATLARSHPALTRAPWTRADMLWASIVGVAVGLSLIAALAPEVEYDALWYHLWLPRLWLEHGRPVDVLAEYVSLYPLTWELLYGDAMTLGGAVAAKLLHFACLPLVAAVTWRLARRVVGHASAWLAAALTVTVPLVFWEATTAYIDLAVALYVTLGIDALLQFLHHDDSQASPGLGEVPWLRYAALAFGLAVAIKHLALIVVALACAALAVLAFRPAAAHRVVPGGGSQRRHLLTAAITIGVLALALGLPWYWRAWAASGNPFFPELFKVFGARPPQRWDAITERGLDAFKAHFGFARTPTNLALLPWNVTQHGAAFGGCLGPVFLALLPWLATGAARRSETRWLLYVVLGYAAAWASPVSSFQLRFLVPVLPLLCVLAAAALARLFAPLRTAPRRIARALLAVLLLLNLPPFIPLHEGDRSGWTGWLTHVTRALPLPVVAGRRSCDEYLRAEVATYGAWTYLARTAPADAVVLDVGGGDNFYATRTRIPVDATLARGVWAEGNAGGATVRATLERLKVTHVVFDRGWLDRMAREGAALGDEQFRRDALQLQHEEAPWLVYLVPGRSSTIERSLRPN